ncbi:hypothetical protein [Lactococcus taiwanensis]|uniref:hypothetical protein n=1 Tax=Lactococcus taiwanensis TaxID=1151742 RepID=UPI00351966C1
MFKRKKFMALCATTLAGVSALGSFAPIAALADVDKSGDTVITYEGAPKPVEWGLSVPATIKLENKISLNGRDICYGNGKVAIVNEEGQSLVDASKDRTFSVSGNCDSMMGDLFLKNVKKTAKAPCDLYATFPNNQGDPEPVTLTSEA